MLRWLIPLLALNAACRDEGCLRGNDATCVVAPACPALPAPSCDAPAAVARIIGPDGDPLAPVGPNALAATGDVLLANDHVVAVIDAIDHPHYVAPTGGNLVDLASTDGRVDGIRQIMTVIGLLPEDAPNWTDVRILGEADGVPEGVAAVQVSGHLDDRPDVLIYTRYELRPCDPGIRVRTELVHRGELPLSTLLSDGFYWGDREQIPFTPYPGEGFTHPSFGLSTLNTVLREVPYMVGATHPGHFAGVGIVGCNRSSLTGLQSNEVSVAGLERRVLLPRDVAVFERFLSVADGRSVASNADVLLGVRAALFGEATATLRGRILLPAGDPGDPSDPIRAQVLISEGTGPAAERVPWTHVVPDADGAFAVTVPADRRYTLEVEAFGQVVASEVVDVPERGEAIAPDITLPAVGALRLSVTVDGAPDPALVMVRAATEQAEDALMARFLGTFAACAPLLGHPYGDSPACDRVVVEGTTDVLVPPGDYEVFTVAGPFSTLDRRAVSVAAAATTTVDLAVTTLPLVPDGTLSADFHVHSGPSFDSSLGDVERVRALVAARMDVVASTEHDVVTDLDRLNAELGYDDRLVVINGTESTGHVLFDLFPDSSFPRVIGHFNFWPVPFDPQGAWRGAPWDEEQQPGALMSAMAAAGWPSDAGVAQLNHPYGGFSFGRDFGWADAIDLNLLEPLPATADGSGPGLFRATPPGAAFANDAYHTQEVMNGSNNATFLAYRAMWFWMLDQGTPRAGTANSDAHSLTDNVIGFPRNLVAVDTAPGPGFDQARFNAAVRDGRMTGTNGPVIELSTTDAAAGEVGPSTQAIRPAPGASLSLRVSAAPWVPVAEVRVYVNGEVVERFTDLPAPGGELLRLEASLPLAGLLPASGDAWIVVEAGSPLVPQADLDCNGFPDTGDNNGDGAIDWRDVDGLEEDPEQDCLETVGPLLEPPLPPRGDPGYAFRVVVPDGYPLAFTNPLLIDTDGDGFEGVSK